MTMISKVARFIGLTAILLTASSVEAASYVCSAKTQNSCFNGKTCKSQSVDDNAYFIVDLTAQTFQECQIDDCRYRLVNFWKGEGNSVLVSHREIPRITRLTLFSDSASDLSRFTQSTLSSVMTVVQSGDCMEQLRIPPPIAIPTKD